MTNADSLRTFGTIAFGHEFMQQTISKPTDAAGRVDADAWFDVVPDVYKADALKVANSVLESHLGEKLTNDNLHSIVNHLHTELLRRLEPR